MQLRNLALAGGACLALTGVPTFVQPSMSSLRGSATASSDKAVQVSQAEGIAHSRQVPTALGLGFCGVALAAAAASSRRTRTRRAAAEAPSSAFDPAEQVGAMAPLGYFDPLGFANKGDQQGFNILRAAEIKHGRVAMMASIGLVAQHFLKFPGFEAVPSGIGALNTQLGFAGFFCIFVWSGVLEIKYWKDEPGNFRKAPGNFGDPLKIGMYDQSMREKEINNGRMAMISVFGILGAELASGKDAIQQFGL